MTKAVDIRTSKASRALAVHDLDPSGMTSREIVRHLARAIGRAVIHNEQPETWVREDTLREDRQVLTLVVRRDNDDDVLRRHARPPVVESEREAAQPGAGAEPSIAAAAMMSTGSITGMRKRSCGKKI